MRNKLVVQSPDSIDSATVLSALQQSVGSSEMLEVFVGAAYATVSGIRTLLTAVPDARGTTTYRWILGLDDLVTQPGALELCKQMPRSTLRVAELHQRGARFHPKVILFKGSRDSDAMLCIGSANLTREGLLRNCEAVAIHQAESLSDLQLLQSVADATWNQGSSLSDQRLTEYKAQYESAQAARPLLVDSSEQAVPSTTQPRPVLESDNALVDPAIASTCWIEVGKATAMGRELEFKAEQALFFGLNPRGEAPQERVFVTSDGQRTSLRLKYQQNAMWRLQLNNSVPEVDHGLRPYESGGLGRSPFVAVFQRVGQAGEYSLRFVLVTDPEYRQIQQRSLRLGTLGSTSSRQYGWY